MKWMSDKKISFRAKGIMYHCGVFPRNTEFSISDLAESSKDGKDSIRNGIKELIDNGYLEISPNRDSNGNFSKSTWKFKY